MTSWVLPPSKYIGEVKKSHADLAAKKALRVLARLINDTPKDTGYAAANWLPTIATPAKATRESTAHASLLAEAANLFDPRGLPAFPLLYLTNNVPYISALNYGKPPGKQHSLKAPLHFVEAAINDERGK